MNSPKECIKCKIIFVRKKSAKKWAKQKYCSTRCVNIGNKNAIGHKPSAEVRKNWSIVMKGRYLGKNSPCWIEDRSKLAKRQERNDVAYQDWRKNIWLRDGFKCQILNENCNGRIEAHHILGWSSYPELRYEINNGITLCHAHHPRKRAEEKQLESVFQALISQMN